jgi:hypothetical protein
MSEENPILSGLKILACIPLSSSANQEHVDRLLQEEAWNQWRQENCKHDRSG